MMDITLTLMLLLLVQPGALQYSQTAVDSLLSALSPIIHASTEPYACKAATAASNLVCDEYSVLFVKVVTNVTSSCTTTGNRWIDFVSISASSIATFHSMQNATLEVVYLFDLSQASAAEFYMCNVTVANV